MLENTVIYKPL